MTTRQEKEWETHSGLATQNADRNRKGSSQLIDDFGYHVKNL